MENICADTRAKPKKTEEKKIIAIKFDLVKDML